MYYTYVVIFKKTGHFYYGCRYSKNANPDDLWVTYFTSSSVINEMIDEFGKDSFHSIIRKTFDCPIKTQQWENKVIRRIINNPMCLNRAYGNVVDPNKSNYVRTIDFGNGSSYKKAAILLREKRFSDIVDGKNSYQRAGMKLSETLKNNPIILEKRKKSQKKSLDLPYKNGNGETLREYYSEKIKGDKNPMRIQKNKEKHRKSMLSWASNRTPEQINKAVDKFRETCYNNDVFEKHSKRMADPDVNKAIGSSWYNNGKKNIRLRPGDDIPIGYVKGRHKTKKLKRTEHTCPVCNKTGRGPNMKRYHFENCKQR